MANKKISELTTRTPSLSDLMLVGDPSSGYSFKCTVTALATIIETDIADGYVTLGTAQTISGAKTFSNNLTLTSVSNAGVDTDKFLVLSGSNVINFRTGAELLSDIGGQGTITLTTTGTSGAATLVGNTLNIPNYTTDLSGYVPTSRTITINGTSQDLTANRTYNVGTVTSITGGTGLTGGIITGSGTLAFDTTWGDARYQQVLTNPITGTGTTGQVAYFNGTNSITSSPTFAFTPTSQLLVNNSVTAAGAIARGINATPSLTAAANNDVLVGLDINPTFTNGAFTGVTNNALRVTGISQLNGNVNTTGTINATATTDGFYTHTFTNSSTGTSAVVRFLLQGNDGGGAALAIERMGSNYVGTGARNAGRSVILAGSSGLALAASQSGGDIRFYTGDVTAASERMRLSVTNGNLLINTTTDAGFRLDISGTARVQGSTTITGSTTASAGVARGINATPTLVAAANNDVLVGLDINPTFTNGAFTGVSNFGLRVGGNSGLAFDQTNLRLGIGTPTLGSNLPNSWSGTGTTVEITSITTQSSGLLIRRGGNNSIGLDVWSKNDAGSSYIDNRYDQAGAFGLNIRVRTSGTPRTVAIFDDEVGAKLGDWTNNRSNAARIEGDLSFRSGGGSRTITGPLNAALIINARPSLSTEGVILQYNGSTGFLLNNAGNVLVNTTTDAGFRLDISGTARVQGQLTVSTGGAAITGAISATSNLHRFGNIQVLTSGSPTSTGVGMTCVGVERDFEFYGGSASAGANMFSFNHWNGQTIGVTNVDRSMVRLYSGFTDGNINNVSGNHLWLSPTYNFAGTRTGIVVRGLYYSPTLTSLTNTVHRAIETTTGDVVFGSTSGNVMIGTTTAGGRFTIQPTNDQVGMAISGSSLTGSNAQSLVSLSQTWNTTGNPTAFLLNITNTASGATADLMELQVGGVAQFIVGKSGTIQTTAPAGGTAAAWKLGTVASVSPTSPNRTIEVEVGGTTYYLHAKTTND